MNTDGFWSRISKIIQVYERYDGANKMQIEQHWVIPQTVPYSEQRNWKQQVLENGKLRFRLNIDFRNEMEDSRLNAIKQLITFIKGRLNFSCKSTTAANVDLTECLLDNWLMNNNITVDKIHYLRSLYFFMNFSFQIYFSTAENWQKTESCWNSLKLDLRE